MAWSGASPGGRIGGKCGEAMRAQWHSHASSSVLPQPRCRYGWSKAFKWWAARRLWGPQVFFSLSLRGHVAFATFSTEHAASATGEAALWCWVPWGPSTWAGRSCERGGFDRAYGRCSGGEQACVQGAEQLGYMF